MLPEPWDRALTAVEPAAYRLLESGKVRYRMGVVSGGNKTDGDKEGR